LSLIALPCPSIGSKLQFVAHTTSRKGDLQMRFLWFAWRCGLAVQEQGMKRLTRQSLVTAVIALGASGVALADNDCTLKTLHGSYFFAAKGYNIVAGVAQPKAIVEVIDFHADGTLSVPAATRSVNGVIARSPAGGTGSYSVEADCTGTIAFTGGPSFDVFISRNGEKLWNSDQSRHSVSGNGNPGRQVDKEI